MGYSPIARIYLYIYLSTRLTITEHNTGRGSMLVLKLYGSSRNQELCPRVEGKKKESAKERKWNRKPKPETL